MTGRFAACGLMLLGLFLLCRPAAATVVTQMVGGERATLRGCFREALHSIRIRCERLDDRVLLRSLVQASRRGIDTRIVVDHLTPGLAQVAARHLPHFAVHRTDPADQGRFYRGQDAYALIDHVLMWFGTKTWSPKTWGRKNVLIIDSKQWGEKRAATEYQQLWKRSQAVGPK